MCNIVKILYVLAQVTLLSSATANVPVAVAEDEVQHL